MARVPFARRQGIFDDRGTSDDISNDTNDGDDTDASDNNLDKDPANANNHLNHPSDDDSNQSDSTKPSDTHTDSRNHPNYMTGQPDNDNPNATDNDLSNASRDAPGQPASPNTDDNNDHDAPLASPSPLPSPADPSLSPATPGNSSSLTQSIYGVVDQSEEPTDIFLPSQKSLGPTFLDDGGCFCALRGAPDEQSTAWHCFCNHSQDAYVGNGGKWFNIPDARAPWQNLPIDDATNLPNVRKAMVLPPSNGGQLTLDLVPLNGLTPNPLTIYDQACTGNNQTNWTTTYYGAEANLTTNNPPVAAVPCYRAGTMPIQIQNVSSWLQQGCLEGFLCQNNTINSLPQYCIPINECQEARMAGATCAIGDQNFPMGPFEPVVCSAGSYCPPGGLQQIRCPKGNFCPLGSSRPIKCSAGSYCPAGAQVEYLFVPFAMLITLDAALIILTLFLGWYFAMADHRSYRLVHLPAQLASDAAEKRRGYGKLEDDTEFVGIPANTPGLRRQPTGFLGSLMGNRKSNMQMNINASLELQAFVESMRKAIQGSNFGLSFGFSELGFFPKGAQRPVLQDISGGIKAGTLVGVMGGSGAGKCAYRLPPSDILAKANELCSNVRERLDGQAIPHRRPGHRQWGCRQDAKL